MHSHSVKKKPSHQKAKAKSAQQISRVLLGSRDLNVLKAWCTRRQRERREQGYRDIEPPGGLNLAH